MKFTNILSQFSRFLIVGTLNTGLSYLIYLLLLYVSHYAIAYTVSYLVGIGVSYYLNARLVFDAKGNLKKMFFYLIGYLSQYLLTLFLLFVVVNKLSVPPVYAPFVVLCIAVPLNFLMNKWILEDAYAH